MRRRRDGPQALDVRHDEAPVVVEDQAATAPPAHHPNGCFHRRAAHIGQALAGKVEGQGEPSLVSLPVPLGQTQKRGGKAGLDGIDGERFHGIVSRAQATAHHEGELANDGWVALTDGDQGLRGDLENDRRLHGLGRRRIWTLLDDRHSSEDLPRAQQLEDDILARLGMANDADAPRLDDAQPLGGFTFHEDIVPWAVLDFARRCGEPLDLLGGKVSKNTIGLERQRTLPGRHGRTIAWVLARLMRGASALTLPIGSAQPDGILCLVHGISVAASL
jgi:hypothetical protein